MSSDAQVNGGGWINSGLPPHIKTILADIPERGAGLNLWLFRTALRMHQFCQPEEIVRILREATQEQPIKHGEIERAVERSAPGFLALERVPGGSGMGAWPQINQDLRSTFINAGADLEDLVKALPDGRPGDDLDIEWILDQLFPNNPLLCCGWDLTLCVTAKREDWRGQMAEMQFIVPNPMSSERGLTQEGKESHRCLNNTGSRRYLVIEQDIGTRDEQAAILAHLATLGPLVMIVDSGGKSIHGWFACLDRAEEQQRAFMKHAVSLGADPATWTRCQFVRMPGGQRDGGALQRVLFFNPSVLEGVK